MAVSMGVGCGFWGNQSHRLKGKRKDNRVFCASAALSDQYRTLRIKPGASEMEVKKAFRQLALQYHPDVCKGSNCGVQFHQINEAYDIVMSNLRELSESYEGYTNGYDCSSGNEDGGYDEPMRGMYDSSYDLWEEWMGWEGAGIRDYSSHINPLYLNLLMPNNQLFIIR